MLARYRNPPEVVYARQLVGEIAFGSLQAGESVEQYVRRRLDTELALNHQWVHDEVHRQRMHV